MHFVCIKIVFVQPNVTKSFLKVLYIWFKPISTLVNFHIYIQIIIHKLYIAYIIFVFDYDW